MYPWLLYWAPQYRLPFSGAVRQDISPEVIFGAIEPQAGSGEIEEEIFTSVAAYGKQIGVLTDVVLSLADKSAVSAADAQQALDQLKEIRAKVEEVKSRNRHLKRINAERLLAALAKTDPEGVAQLLRKYA